MKKTLGYVLAGVGVIITALGTIPNLRELIKIIPSAISNLYVMILGLILVIAGIIVLLRNPLGKQPPEVPIYQGKNVVGFRRMSK